MKQLLWNAARTVQFLRDAARTVQFLWDAARTFMVRERALLAAAAAFLLALAFSTGHLTAKASQADSARTIKVGAASAETPAIDRSIIDGYCVGCHNQRAKTAGIILDTADVTRIGENAELWEKVVRKLRGGMMPPPACAGPIKPGSMRSSDRSSTRSMKRRRHIPIPVASRCIG